MLVPSMVRQRQFFNKELEMKEPQLMWATSTIETNKRQYELELKNERDGRESDKLEYELKLTNKDLELNNYKLQIKILELTNKIPFGLFLKKRRDRRKISL